MAEAVVSPFIANLPKDVIEEDRLAPDFTYWTIPTGIIPREVITAPGATEFAAAGGEVPASGPRRARHLGCRRTAIPL